MIEQGFFNKHFVGRDGFQWWIGQIPNADVWQINIPGTRVTGNNQVAGFGQRYKVRIMGYHTANATELTDEDLPWASVMYPVTAGSGNNGSSQSVNLLQGDFVYGFFLDGEDGQQPVIMGVAGFNEYQAVMKNVPDTKFVPFLGLKPGVVDNGFLPLGAQRQTQDQTVIVQTNADGTLSNNIAITAATLGLQDQDKATAEADDRTEREEEALAQPSECEPLPIGKMQLQVRNSIQKIEKIKKSIYNVQSDILEGIGNEQAKIDKEIQKASEFIASSLKWVYEQVEAFITDKTNEALKTVYDLAMPNERNLVKQTSKTILDTIACFFRKIMAQLVTLVSGFLKDAVEKIINVPVCFIENFAGAVIGTVGGAVDGLFQGIGDLVSGVGDIIGEGIDIAGDALGLLDNLLSALSCDDRPECSKINKWNIRAGAGGISKADATGILEKAKGFVQEAQSLGTSALDTFDGLTNIDLSSITKSTDSCNTDAIECGPPGIEFFGSDGAGALGNVIIGVTGEVLAVDMVSFGAGFDENTRAKIVDPCGKGKGAVVRPVFGPVPRSGRSEFSDGEEERQVVGRNIKSTIKTSRRRAKVGDTITIRWNVKNAKRVIAKGKGFRDQVKSDQFSGEVNVTVRKGFKSYSIIGVGGGDRVEANVVVEGTIGKPRRQSNAPYGPGHYRPSAPGEGRQLNPDFPGNPGLLDSPTGGGGGGGGAAPLGFGPFDPNPYPFPGNPNDGAIAPAPFNPTGGIFETPAFGLGPSLNLASPVEIKSPGSVIPLENQIDIDLLERGVEVEFTVERFSDLNNRMTFRMQGLDEDNLGEYQGTGELSFSFTGNDLGKEIRLIRPDTNYIVTGYLPTGEKNPNPLKRIVAKDKDNPKKGFNVLNKSNKDSRLTTKNKGKTIGLDDVFGRKEYQVTETLTRIVRDAAGEAEIIWKFGNSREQGKYDADPSTYFKDKLSDGNKKIRLLDGDGDDTNATFEITEGNGRFSDDGLKVIGKGRIGITLNWRDKPSIAGTAIESITVTAVHVGEDVTWTQTEGGKPDGELIEKGEDFESFFIDPVDREVTETVTKTLLDEGQSDFDYDDLIISVDRGKFKIQDDGTAIFRVTTNVPTPPGDAQPIGGGGVPGGIPARVIDLPLSPGGDDIGIIDVIVIDGGGDYLPGPDGSSGGDGRVWKEPDETIIKHPDGRWDPPIPPGIHKCFLPGDEITLPPGTQVITEPNDGQGGGELIIGGTVYILQKPGCITTPELPPDLPPSDFPPPDLPTGGEGTYPVILYLCEIIIRNRGFGYTPGDKVVIEPSYGASAEATFDELGRVQSIDITNSGEGFKERPNIYIQSETGYNAELIPKLCIDKLDDVNEPDDQDLIINVVDCVGLTANGYLDGEPYYGPFHEHEGRRMVGAQHSDKSHKFLDTNTPGVAGGEGQNQQFITQEQLDAFLNNPNLT
jgi:hypothetical protein